MRNNVRVLGRPVLRRCLGALMIVTVLASCASIDQMAQKQCAVHYRLESPEYDQCVAKETAAIQSQFATQESDAPFNHFMPLTVVPGVD